MNRSRSVERWTPPRRPLPLLIFIFLQFANIFDAASTLLMTGLGAEEVNPVMAWALNRGPTVFLAIKLPLIVIVTGIMLRWVTNERSHPVNRRMAWWALCLSFVLFALLSAYHVFGLVLTAFAYYPS
jgi:hypothetical protein